MDIQYPTNMSAIAQSKEFNNKLTKLNTPSIGTMECRKFIIFFFFNISTKLASCVFLKFEDFFLIFLKRWTWRSHFYIFVVKKYNGIELLIYF